MLRRNPHVFGPEAESGRTFTLEEIEEMWQAAKAAERTDPAAPPL
jgi:hypothetical protein